MDTSPARPEHVVDLMKAGFNGMVDKADELLTIEVSPGETQVLVNYALGTAAASTGNEMFPDTFVMLQLIINRAAEPAELTHTMMMTRSMAMELGANLLMGAMDSAHDKRSI